MADFDPDYEQITKLMVERVGGYASPKTQAKELMEMTGLEPDVAEAFFKGLTPRGAGRPSDVRGYAKKHGYQGKKKTPPKRG
jgi:hypothetical protein